MRARVIARLIMLVLMALAVASLALADPVELDAGRAVQFAKASGRLPPWFGLTDSVRLVYRPGYVYACIRDFQTGARWTTGGPLPSLRQALLTGRWLFSEPRPYTEADRAVCWP